MAALASNLARLNGGSLVVSGVPRTFGVYHFVTNHTVAEVETNGFFDALADYFTPGSGDVILACMDLDGTPALKNYVVTRAGTDITLTAEVDADT